MQHITQHDIDRWADDGGQLPSEENRRGQSPQEQPVSQVAIDRWQDDGGAVPPQDEEEAEKPDKWRRGRILVAYL